jgi:2-keto-4-pentenoate hydratase
MHPAIELVGLCLPPAAFRDVRWCIADHALDVAFIAGAAVADWRTLELPALTVRSVINGTEVAVGSGAAVLGSPVLALTWLANALSSRGHGLRADDWVSTGTCTGIQMVRSGDSVEAVFDRIGSVRAAFS